MKKPILDHFVDLPPWACLLLMVIWVSIALCMGLVVYWIEGYWPESVTGD